MTDFPQGPVPGNNAPGGERSLWRFRGQISPVAYGLIILVVVFFLYQVVGGILTYLFLGSTVTKENVNLMRTTSLIGQVIFMLIPSIWLVHLNGWNLRKHFRIRAPGWRPVLLVILSVASLQIILQVYLFAQEYVLQNYLTPDSLKPLIESIRKMINELYAKLVYADSPLELTFVILVIAVTPAICEESVFRGAVQSAFEKSLPLKWALLLCGTIFALFHLNPFAFVPLVILGTYFSFIVWRGGSIFLSVIAHFTNNAIAAIFLYFLGTESIITPSETGGDISTLVLLGNLIAGLLVFVVSTYFFWKTTTTKEQPSSNHAGDQHEVLS